MEFHKYPLVGNIQRFSVDDGPGIRTTVFFKGCNLRCLWCHNPECISPALQVSFAKQNCMLCGRCISVCPNGAHAVENGVHIYRREPCTACGRCVSSCRSGALARIGRPFSPEALICELQKDERFFAAGGGVTVSGGEPMLYPGYISELLSLCKARGWHTAVDTAGNVPFSHFEAVLPHTDLFLYDIKLMDETAHRAATGVSNALIKENLQRLDAAGARYFIRVPVVPGVNDDFRELSGIADFLASLNPALVQLLPYHSYGAGKYEALAVSGFLPALSPPDGECMQKALALFSARGLPAQIS